MQAPYQATPGIKQAQHAGVIGECAARGVEQKLGLCCNAVHALNKHPHIPNAAAANHT